MGNLCKKEQVNQSSIDMTHFEPYRAMGKGGFGSVELVKHKASGDLMAIKSVVKRPCVDSDSRLRVLWKERRILALLKNPFVVYLVWAFQDAKKCYMVMPFLSGGDLNFYIKNKKRMKEDRCQFYAVEIILALEHLHSIHIVHRDIKPENLLLDEEGHLVLVDFGVADRLRQSRDHVLTSRTGTRMYMAPEQYKKEEYSYSVDLWALGITLCELLTGKKPFKSKEKILGNKPTYNRALSKTAKSLLDGLLEKDSTKRLGCGKDGITGLRSHEFFEGVDWKERYHKKVDPPYIPQADMAHCDPTEMIKDLMMQPEKDEEAALTPEQQAKFVNFEFNTSLTDPPIKNEHRLKMLKRAKKKNYSVTLSKAPSTNVAEFGAARASLAMHGPED
eukprot:1013151_1